MDPARASSGQVVARRSRGITRYRIDEAIHSAGAPRGRLGPGLVWIAVDRLDSIVLSGPHRRWVAQILAEKKSKKASRPQKRSRAA